MITLDPVELSLEDVKIQLENYRTTILALQAFISLVTWEPSSKQKFPESHYSIGRKMLTSPLNRVSPNQTITPDAVVQRNPELGYIVEVKKSLERNRNESWLDHAKQLEKYDDDLIGWWTDDESILISCPVLLLHQSRMVEFYKYLIELINSNQIFFEKPTSLVEFNKSPEEKEYLFLRLYWGKIEGTYVFEKLEKGCQVPLEKLLTNPDYGRQKFYDAKPIPEYIMEILWQHIFPDLKRNIELDEKSKVYPITVNAGELTKELQKLWGDIGDDKHLVIFPRIEWIRESLDCFTKLKLAKRIDDNGNYLIMYKTIKTELIGYFQKWREVQDSKGTAQEVKQLPLFSTNEKIET